MFKVGGWGGYAVVSGSRRGGVGVTFFSVFSSVYGRVLFSGLANMIV